MWTSVKLGDKIYVIAQIKTTIQNAKPRVSTESVIISAAAQKVTILTITEYVKVNKHYIA